MYPPSFQVTVIGQQATAPAFVTVHLMLGDTSFSMTLPLSNDSLSSLKGKMQIIMIINFQPILEISNSIIICTFIQYLPVDALNNLQVHPLTTDSLLKRRKVTHAQLHKEIENSDLIPLTQLFDNPSLYIDQFELIYQS